VTISSLIILTNWFILLGVPSGLTPVSIPASGKRLIIAPVKAIADKPGLFFTSQSSSIAGITGNAGLTVSNAFFIPSEILVIQLILF
jgi:hypothetical protein